MAGNTLITIHTNNRIDLLVSNKMIKLKDEHKNSLKTEWPASEIRKNNFELPFAFMR